MDGLISGGLKTGGGGLKSGILRYMTLCRLCHYPKMVLYVVMQIIGKGIVHFTVPER